MENLLSCIIHTVFQECYQFQENEARLSSDSSCVAVLSPQLCHSVTRSLVSSILKDCSAFTFQQKEVLDSFTLKTEGSAAAVAT